MTAKLVQHPRFLLFALLLLTGCGRAEPIAVAQAANAGGVDIRARSEVQGDSVRVAVQFTNNLDTTTDLILHGCPITLVVHDGLAPLWDERERQECRPAELSLAFAPGEYRVLTHTVARNADPSLAAGRDAQIAVRVMLVGGREYLLSAQPRFSP
jgi:hypothetical protein